MYRYSGTLLLGRAKVQVTACRGVPLTRYLGTSLLIFDGKSTSTTGSSAALASTHNETLTLETIPITKGWMGKPVQLLPGWINDSLRKLLLQPHFLFFGLRGIFQYPVYASLDSSIEASPGHPRRLEEVTMSAFPTARPDVKLGTTSFSQMLGALTSASVMSSAGNVGKLFLEKSMDRYFTM